MSQECKTLKWGKGLVKYEKEDLMTEEEIYGFSLNVVENYALKNGYEVFGLVKDKDMLLSGILKKNEEFYFLIVQWYIYPLKQIINLNEKIYMYVNAKTSNAKLLYASVGFASSDKERGIRGIALRDDAYYISFHGFEEINLTKDEYLSDFYKKTVLHQIGMAYRNYNLDLFSSLIDDTCTWYSPWSKVNYENGEKVKEYYLRKFATFKKSNPSITFDVVEDVLPKNGLSVSKLLLKQTLNGKYNDMLIDIVLNEKGMIIKINLEDFSKANLKPLTYEQIHSNDYWFN